MIEMIKIIRPRGCGKTTSLLKLARENGYIVVEPTKKHAEYIQKMADITDCIGVCVISFQEFLRDSAWSRQKYLIDELDLSIEQMGVIGYSNTGIEDKWIPVSDHLPPEHDTIFAKLKGTDKWRDAMFEKQSDDVRVVFRFEDGTRRVGHSYTVDGVWECEKPNRYLKRTVTHWCENPELPEEEA